MPLVGRRAVTAMLAGATLTSTGLARQSQAQTVLTPAPDHAVELRSIDTIKATTPPAPLAQNTFTDADGHEFTPASFLGKGLVINLWATWCVPCVAEMPALDRLAAALHSEGIVVLPLSSDRGGAAKVRAFYDSHAVAHLGVWLDKFGLAAQGWGARGLPTTIIVDRQGCEQARLEGGVAWDTPEAIAAIRELVG